MLVDVDKGTHSLEVELIQRKSTKQISQWHWELWRGVLLWAFQRMVWLAKSGLRAPAVAGLISGLSAEQPPLATMAQLILVD